MKTAEQRLDDYQKICDLVRSHRRMFGGWGGFIEEVNRIIGPTIPEPLPKPDKKVGITTTSDWESPSFGSLSD